MLQNKINTEIPSVRDTIFDGFLRALKNGNFNFIDMETKLKFENFTGLVSKENITRAVKEGFLIKQGNKWKVNKEKLNNFYKNQLYFKKGACI